MNNLHVKTGDNVMVISGKGKGKTGKVIVEGQTSPVFNVERCRVRAIYGKVIVEGLNMVTKHVKPRRSRARRPRLRQVRRCCKGGGQELTRAQIPKLDKSSSKAAIVGWARSPARRPSSATSVANFSCARACPSARAAYEFVAPLQCRAASTASPASDGRGCAPAGTGRSAAWPAVLWASVA